jgi:hypothetical protein
MNAWTWIAGIICLAASQVPAAADEAEMQRQILQLQQQNEVLQQQMRQQQQVIEDLTGKVSAIQAADQDRRAGKGSDESAEKNEMDDASTSSAGTFGGKLHIGGEGAVGLFHSQSRGRFPNTEFRVDEAKLFLEAPIISDVYLFSEINLFSRESSSPNVRVGELYLDFEDLSRFWNRDRQLNLRAGRFDIPFGEEYLTRDAIDNPLISHSLMDLWGVDEGVEIYGSLGRFQYVLAIQNGGHDALRDYNSDKAVIARVGVDPTKWLHLSASAMRTGKLDVDGDETSELWLGSGFVRSLGSGGTTVFEADLLQGDLELKFARTTIKAAGGVLQYDDNDPTANNRREVYHYHIEGVQKIHRGLYAAARWSQAFAADGFPIAGIGDDDRYYEDVLTRRLWLLSLGVGYRWNDRLLLKAEYSFARGRELGGTARDHEDTFAAQAAFAF